MIIGSGHNHFWFEKTPPSFDELEAEAIRETKGTVMGGVGITDEVQILDAAISFVHAIFDDVRMEFDRNPARC